MSSKMNLEDICHALSEPSLVNDLEVLSKKHRAAPGIHSLHALNIDKLRAKTIGDENFFLVTSAPDGTDEEALFVCHGFIAGFDTIPVEQYRGRTIFKPETLSHRIKLCGGGSGAFESSVQSLQSLYNFSSMYLPGPSRHAKDTSTPPVLMASTPILSKVTRGDGPRYNIAPVPPSYKLPARMLELLNSGKFCFTEDNFVEYTEIEVKNGIDGLAVMSIPTSPLMFRPGQLVTIVISIRASKGRDSIWFTRPHLHSVALVGRKGSMRLMDLETRLIPNNDDQMDTSGTTSTHREGFPSKRKLVVSDHGIDSSMKKLTLGDCGVKQSYASAAKNNS